MHKRHFLPFGMLLAVTLITGSILVSSGSFADMEEQSDATVTVASACTMFRESTIPHVAVGTIGTYHEDVGTTRLKTICNDKDGYAIYAIGYSNDTAGDTNMYGEEYGEVIPTGTASGDVSNWSMKLAKDLNSYNPENLTITTGFENYHDVPSFQTKVASFEGATDTTDGSVVTTTYAIRVSSTQLADTYTGQVRYTMVHPSDGTTPEGPEPVITYVQDITPETCPTTPTIVVDSRDGEEYYIAKLADNNCWLLDNLRLDPATLSVALTPENTNMDANTPFTLPSSSNSGDSYTVAKINTASKDVISSYGSGTNKIGVYYNYCAASAGTYCFTSGNGVGNAEYDICPKGWRMATGGTEGEYYGLRMAYNDNVANLKNALHSSFSGMYNFSSGSARYQGETGHFWSSTRSDGWYMYHLTIGEYIYPLNHDERSLGISVRCIAKEPEQPKLYIQDVTIDTCPTTTTVAYDKRDEQPYTIKKINGDCWMTTNLNLAGGTQLTSELSNVVTPYTLEQSSNEDFRSYENENVYNTGNTDCSNNQPCYSYYSLKAALAGALDYGEPATQDICPKGWKIPNADKANEFRFAFINNMSDFNSSEWNPTHSGYYYRESVYNTNQFGYYWTSTNLGPQSATRLRMGYDVYNNTGWTDIAVFNDNNSDGLAVRCIAKEPEPEPLTFQSFDSDSCPTTPTVVTDFRDGEEYTIQKLADGNCWMLDNLRLDLTDTNVKNNLASDTTNASDTTLIYLKNGGGTSSDQFAESGVVEWSGAGVYTYPQISTSQKTSMASYGDGENKVGIYYNYCAATAGSYCYDNLSGHGNATEDICPAGWRMPTSGDDGEYNTLFEAYESDPGSFSSALRTSPSGFTSDSGSVAYPNGIAGFWASTFDDVHQMKFANSSVSPSVTTNAASIRNYGWSIRCIAKNGSEPDPIHDIQNVTPETCPTTPTIVYDTRDNQSYTIQKLADGKCWMLDNLRLGRSTVKVLTPDDTNIHSNFTLPGSVSTGFDEFEIPQINIDSKNDTTSYGDGENKIGVYYNFCAATAGTYCQPQNTSSGIPSEDICPKGWRLPTGGENGEYQNLYAQYNSYADFKNALRASLSGYFKYAQTNHQGSYGSFWSSTPVGDDRMYSLDVRATSVPNDFTSYRTAGISIRCVAYDVPETYIQDVTLDNCPTTPTTVYDTRDNSAYTIQKLEDGNCWMLDNLRIGRSTMKVLTPNDTNITRNFTLPGSVSIGFDEFEIPQINIDSKNKITSYGAGDNKIGVYYNYCAATAGTYCYAQGESDGNATEDVCPKGWRLPTGGEEGEYQNLYSKYNTYADFKNALHVSLSGYFKYSSKNHQGSYGSYWSATPVGDDRMYSLDVRAESVPNDFTSYRTAGLTIRCIAKRPLLPHYIQEVTTSICPTEPSTVYDIRDDEPYIIQKLADGRCWLMEDLRLDPATLKETLTSQNTNMPADSTFTLPASIKRNFATNTSPAINTDSKNTELSNGEGTSKIGVYYNYCAASAGTYCYANAVTEDAHYDICPKGWRMPTGGDGGEYEILYNSYGNDKVTFRNAFRVVLSGDYARVNAYGQDNRGYFWSSTNNNDQPSTMHYLDVETSRGVITIIGTSAYSPRDFGLMVRCVAN